MFSKNFPEFFYTHCWSYRFIHITDWSWHKFTGIKSVSDWYLIWKKKSFFYRKHVSMDCFMSDFDKVIIGWSRIWMNSSNSIIPLPSLSIFWNNCRTSSSVGFNPIDLRNCPNSPTSIYPSSLSSKRSNSSLIEIES